VIPELFTILTHHRVSCYLPGTCGRRETYSHVLTLAIISRGINDLNGTVAIKGIEDVSEIM
jgi:hypothetical protein